MFLDYFHTFLTKFITGLEDSTFNLISLEIETEIENESYSKLRHFYEDITLKYTLVYLLGVKNISGSFICIKLGWKKFVKVKVKRQSQRFLFNIIYSYLVYTM